MAPRSGKRKYRGSTPMPIWIPLPRPCIRSMNMPGPYYIPVPEMCMQWLPPPYFPKPMCHCTNENYCTASNCKNSAECHKLHPEFCPYGPIEDGLDLHQDNTQNNVENNNEEQTSSISDIDVCTSCGTSFRSRKVLKYTKQHYQEYDRNPSYTSKEPIRDDSYSYPYISQVQRKEDSNPSPLSINMPRRKEVSAQEIDINAPKNVLKDGDDAHKMVSTQHPAYSCTDSSCQTPVQLGESSNLPSQGRNSTQVTSKSVDAAKRNSISISSETSYSADVENSIHRLPPLNTESSQRSLEKNSLGCTTGNAINHTITKPNQSVPINSSSGMEFTVLSDEPTVKKIQDKIHVDQLSDHLSHARSQKNCCSDLPKTYKMKPANYAPAKDKTQKKTSKIHSSSECGCSSTKISMKKARDEQRKSSSNIRKASECECNLTQVAGNASKNKLSKSSSNIRKPSECGCLSTKRTVDIAKNEASKSLSKINSAPKCSCSVTKLPAKKSSSKKIRGNSSLTKNPKTGLKTPNEANIASLSAANLKPLTCQCKFPPAYSHLSCSSNPSGNCRCSSDT